LGSKCPESDIRTPLGSVIVHVDSVPNGQGRSKLMEALVKRRLRTTLTVRNWRTVESALFILPTATSDRSSD